MRCNILPTLLLHHSMLVLVRVSMATRSHVYVRSPNHASMTSLPVV